MIPLRSTSSRAEYYGDKASYSIPELFSRKGSWDDLIDHIKSTVAVNKWEEADKLRWIWVHTQKLNSAYIFGTNFPMPSRRLGQRDF